MQIVIDIPEEIYNSACAANNIWDMRMAGFVCSAIANGTPLPEECDIQRIIPKRVDVKKWIYTECPNPNCDYALSTHHGDGYYSIEHKPDFCPNCGQALLWESEG